MNNKIDFIITWVDSSDPKWLTEKNKYTPDNKSDSGNNRYRDWNNLKYWFRGIEKYAPWVNNVYFITYGHLPKWLNVEHPKLKIIKHSDYIPKKYLPTFNSNVIEMNIHRIKGLSDNFVLFNDDFFLINPTEPSDFFKNGLPRDSVGMCAYKPMGSDDVMGGISNNNISIINKYYCPRKVVKKSPFKWVNFKNGKYLYNNIVFSVYKYFTGIHSPHLPVSFMKGTFEEIWNKEYKKLDEVCRNRFRTRDDVNQWLMEYWQNCKGDFKLRSASWGKYYEYGMGYDELRKVFNSKKYLATCLNDTVADEEFENAKRITNELFEAKFPEKSEFEK